VGEQSPTWGKIMINITYDRKEKHYQWTDPTTGETFQFTSEQKRSGAAFQFAVSMLESDLYEAAQRIIANHPQLERATWRAVELVVRNAVGVFPAPANGVLAMVNSSDGFGRYAIAAQDGYTSCQCENFTSMDAPMTASGARYCKHILAYRLQLTRENRF